MSNVAPPRPEPIRSPARELDAQVGRALGLVLRETTARASPGGPMPAGSIVIVYEHQDDVGEWRKLPHYSSDPSLIPTLLAALRERLGDLAMFASDEDEGIKKRAYEVWKLADLDSDRAWEPIGAGRTLSEALSQAVVAAAGAKEEAAPDG